MSAWIARFNEAVDAFAAGLLDLPNDATTASLRAALDRARALTDRPSSTPPAALGPILAGAVHALLCTLTDAGTRAALLGHVAAAQGALASATPFEPHALRADAPPLERPLRASRESPRLHAPRRTVFPWPPPGPAAAPPTGALEGPGTGAPDATPDGDDDLPPLAKDHDFKAERAPLPAPDLPAGAPKALVWLDGDGHPARPLAELHQRAADACLETIATVQRSRARYAWSERANHEQRILTQSDAIPAAHGDVLGRALAYLRSTLDLAGPSRRWAVAFVIASLEGDDAMLAVLAALDALPATALDDALAIAAALDASPHPAALTAARAAQASPHPAVRAFGIDLRSRRGDLSGADLRPALLDASPAVAATAARAVARLDAETAAPLLPLLRGALAFPEATVAFEAARALLLHDDPSPYEAVRASDPALDHLGLHAADILVLRGDAHDLETLQKILGRHPTSPRHLALVARFGHPASWAYLLHHLRNEDLADDAAAALVRLFGPLVEPGAERSVPAWRAAITARRPSPEVRLFGGDPWRPRAIAAALAASTLSQLEMEPLLDELAVRAQVTVRPQLDRWTPVAAAELQRASQEAVARDARYRAGSWSVAAP